MQTSGHCFPDLLLDRIEYDNRLLYKLRPRLNQRLLTNKVCDRVKDLELKRDFRWQRGNPVNRQKRRVKVMNNTNANNLRTLSKGEEPRDGINITTANVRSIRQKTEEFKHHIQEKNIVLGVITETWVKDEEPDIIEAWKLKGFDVDNIPRSSLNEGGGVALYYRKDVQVKRLGQGEETTFQHAEWRVELGNDVKLIAAVYRPPDKRKVSKFLDEFGEYIDNIANNNIKSMILMGDLNFHLEDREDTEQLSFRDLLDAYNLKQHVNCPTHRDGHTLDTIITKKEDEIELEEPVDTMYISDHSFVDTKLVKRTVEAWTNSTTVRFKRNIKSVDRNIMQEHMEKTRLQIADGQNLNEKVNILTAGLEEMLDEVAPKKECKSRPKKTKVKWFDDKARELKKHRRRLEKRYKTTKNERDKEAYKTANKEYVSYLKRMKWYHINKEVKDSKGDTKKLFKTVWTLLGKVKDTILPDYTDDEQLVVDFNNFFYDKITKIRENLKAEARYIPTQDDESGPKLFKFRQVEKEEILKIIAESKITECRTDAIPTSLLKENIEVLIDPIMDIINESLLSGVFPDRWKQATILPLIKKKGLDANVLKNFRPVNNLNYLSKILEKLMLNQLMDHINTNSLMPDYLSAYRANYSTETVLMKIHNEVLEAFEKKEGIILVGLDLSAAFDTVDHGILLDVLDQVYRVRGPALKWITSYLENRSQIVQINSVVSDPKSIDFSVPQGSVLGPVLYNIYSSTLSQVINAHLQQILGYADDKTLYKKFSIQGKGNSAEIHVRENLETCLEDVVEWTKQNRLKINTEKTEVIVFSSSQLRNKVNTTEMKVGEDTVQTTETVKYVGMWLDSTMNLKHQITKVCSKTASILGLIRRNRKYLTLESCKTIVQALILTQLDYGNALYYGLPQSTLGKMQRLQNNAARTILKWPRYASASEAMRELHWLPIIDRITFKIATIVYKCLKGDAPKYLSNMLTIKEVVRDTRSSSNNKINLVEPWNKKKTHADRGFKTSGPVVWNKLPEYVQKAETLDSFKKQLKTYLFESRYY